MQPAFGTVWSLICWTVDASLGLTAGTQVGGGSSVFRIIAPLSRMDSRFCRIQSLGSSHQIHLNHRRQESMWVLIKVTNVKASLHVTICRSDIIGFRIVTRVWCSTLGPIWNPKKQYKLVFIYHNRTLMVIRDTLYLLEMVCVWRRKNRLYNSTSNQEPMSRSMELHYISVTAFL